MTAYVYVLIRTDMPIEHQVTQACHASFELGLDVSRFQTEPCHLITLAVPDQRSLCEWRDKLVHKGIQNHLFYDSDDLLGNGRPTGFTALATAPVEGGLREFFSRLKLWRYAPKT